MALTPEDALYDAIDSAGSEAKKKYRDIIHLPFFFVNPIWQNESFQDGYAITEEDQVPEYRSNEFSMRSQGKTYLEISKMGGGINSSVNSLRKASEKDLYNIP